MGLDTLPREPHSYSLIELLDANELPELCEGDTIPFVHGTVQELYAVSLILIDSMNAPYKPILKADENGLQKRIQHDKVTGLKLSEVELVDFGKFDLFVNSTLRQMEGWEARVRGTMRYPGYGEVALDFPFVVLRASNFYRIGPYDPDKRIITSVRNEEIGRALAASKNLGAFATSGAARNVGKKGTGMREAPPNA